MGYAIPGTVIAVGVLIPFAWFDNSLDTLLMENLNISSGLLISGTLFTLVFAYLVRFLAVSINTVAKNQKTKRVSGYKRHCLQRELPPGEPLRT
jgi:ABC-type Fe3+ transport system permease subunit